MMKVRELIEQLQRFDGELEVVVGTGSGDKFQMWELDDVEDISVPKEKLPVLINATKKW